MIQLITPRFSSLPAAAHYNFFTQVNAAIAASPEAVTSALGDLIAAFDPLLAEEKAHMDWIRKSVLTAKIEAADQVMDGALTTLRTSVRAMTSFQMSSAVKDAAVRVYTMLMSYGDVNRKPYEDQRGDLQTILSQISTGGAYFADMSQLSGASSILSGMISALRTAFTAFESLLAQRDTQSLQKPERPLPEVRHDIEAVYRKIAGVIDAGALLNVTPAFAAFIDSLNPEIERLNAEHRRVRHDIAACEPEPIPAQAYTGRPVTPSTFKVLYMTLHDGTIQLELGKDYNLTYKDNKDVGNAEVTIHGKGAYKGAKTVTFIIKHGA
jgi:hypothetical protein